MSIGDKKLLITGATGFIGVHLIDEAISQGYMVFIGHRKSSNLKSIDPSKVNLMVWDYDDTDQMAESMAQHNFNYIIHCAGLTRHKSKQVLVKTNAGLTQNLVTAISKSKISLTKFVYVSSLAAMGPTHATKMLDLETIPAPITNYGKSKLEAEHILTKTKSLPYIIIRPTVVYGPREKDLFLSFKLIKKGFEVNLGKGDQIVSFIYVKDLVRLLIDSLQSKITNKIYLASDGNNIRAKDFQKVLSYVLNQNTRTIHLSWPILRYAAYLNEYFSGLFGKYPVLSIEKAKEIRAKSWGCDISEAIHDLNFTPKWSLEEGLKETADWYVENGWL